MGMYIDREEAIKCFDCSVLIARQSEAEVVGKYFEMVIKRLENLPMIDLVMCKECKYYNGHQEYCDIDHFARENGFCSDGKRRTDYTMFNVNPPKGVETPLNGDATVFYKNSNERGTDEK